MPHLDWLLRLLGLTKPGRGAPASLPDLTSFSYRFPPPTANPKLRAWAKIAESERRLEVIRWVQALDDPGKMPYRWFVDDSIGAFLLTLEAALQFTKEQRRSSGAVDSFESWLTSQPQYDVLLKGLRTLRHLEAHIQDVPIHTLAQVDIHSSLGGPPKRVETRPRIWKLISLDQPTLASLARPTLAVSELDVWNALVAERDATGILADSLPRLHSILHAAERMMPSDA